MTSDAAAHPVSLSQQRLWFTEQLVPGTAVHHLHAQLVVHGELNVAALQRAVDCVIERHDILRTRFDVLDGAPVQEVLDEVRVAVQMVDATDDVSVPVRADEFIREPFDLRNAPLLRVGLVQGSGGAGTLVFVIHHLVADSWSLGLLLREIAELYRQAGPGGVPGLPTRPIRYSAYARQQREWRSTPQAAELCAAQTAELAGFPTLLGLPTDRPRPAVQTFTAASSSWHVPPRLVRELERVARGHGTTLRTFLLASFSTVLRVWSGQERILVATPAAERPAAETQRPVGPVANNLVIPIDMTGSPSFAACLKRTGEAFLRSASRQDVPFEELVDGLAPQRSLSHHRLVQVQTTYREQPDVQCELPAADVVPVAARTYATPFDLVLDATLLAEGLDCRLTYSTDLFDRATAERFGRHLRRLCEVVITDPDIGVEDIELVDAEERAVLAELGTGPTRPIDPRALPDRLSETARGRPDSVAVRGPDGAYTYAQFVERAEAIGRELAARGLRPADLAGVALPRGRDLPAGLLGVWMAGGAYVPLDPAYPRARLEHMTRDAGIKVLLSTRELADRIPVPSGTEVLLLDEPMSARPAARPGIAQTGDSVAYVIYTSGSTGKPKGVLVKHASLGNLLDDFACDTGFGVSDRMLALTSLSFDIAGLELWLPLLTGGTLVLGPPGVGGDPEQLHQLLCDEKITVVQATPATWKLYTETTGAAPPGLRQIWCGGERLAHSLAQALTGLGPEVHNLYGPTETTIWSTRAVLRRQDTVTGIGRPMANTSLHITDAVGRQVPMGVPGELCIGGAGLALGYLGRPDLTSERFTEVQGVPVYRTGDLVRWRSDGNLEFLGRLDDQVKIRGHRIEPGEVDASARTCPGVRDACTLAVPTPAGDEKLVTFVTPESTPDQDAGTTDDWRTIWESTYTAGEPAEEDDFNLKGWQDSYTKQPIPEPHMRDWVARTVERIAEAGARSFAEIGCGTGLLMLRLAPAADRYLGIDFSARAIGHVEMAVARRGLTSRVRLATAAAVEISEVAAGERFDCVILNSVAQYFPSRKYLTAVLIEASKVVAPGGHIFVGDLRSLRLAEAFHAGVLQADRPLGTQELRELAARHALEEDELLIDPGYFAELQDELSAVTGIQISLKDSGFDNEMTRFRYDVLLKIGGETPTVPQPCEYRGWEEVSGFAELDALLTTSQAASVIVDGIPNSRVARFAQLVADDETPLPSCSPAELDEVAARVGWRTHHSWSEQHAEQGRVRTTFTRRGQVQERFTHHRPTATGPVSNNPRRGALLRVLKHSTRAVLRQSLPDYMVPHRVLTLPALPLTPNGKTDRNVLKAMAVLHTSTADAVPPSGPVQGLLHKVWCEVLGVPGVSVTENIFDAGATSLLVVRIRQELLGRHGIDVPLTDFFAHPTIAALAHGLEAATPRQSVGSRAASTRTKNTTAARRRNNRRNSLDLSRENY
ncbi:amino acid adenylation domain-containing protein [Streptomyces gelaticus]|uniref:amino acid adenylation domain-containing protein n=1 Tax=Streptomyces gelaticus TaxID=285446 RepID=UPI00379CF5CE